jgi:hypothetical protein
MKLFNYYNVDECKDREKVFKKLDQLRDDGKIEYEMDGRDIFKIEDLDLEEVDIEELNDMFDSEDVFPYLDNEEEDEDEDYGDEDYDNDY